ncbi:hypothetical protein GGI25_005420 [Coemansia spiralis]|uniref:Phosphoglycolate phosphatase n=2 Tax=Coemansia TaxID=4863 RepID=A0A9W8FYM4_9FUNG|nr:HAD-like domain-containing protein [Coemansia spiralis]KAJ1988247.1 hypothetical protein EDC05_005387 [Coemansia umbellata]KAJ2619612.1 hypothetical protein GGI26_005719 [Coemansia sp. RSA 1358]KAJ2671603.1 hypothetical protein GGI25_005420 [Coemansia spiralis]
MVRYFPSTRESVASEPTALRIRGVVFDMDGTLATPMKEHLLQMRVELKVPAGMGTLEYVDTCLTGKEHELAHKRLIEIENDALRNMQITNGLIPLLQFLHKHSIPMAIITRNNKAAVDHFLNNVAAGLPKEERILFKFDPALDRSFKPPKPAPDGILHISKLWNIPPEQLMMVGDHGDDLLCGLRAGSVATLLRYYDNTEFERISHIVVDRLDRLAEKLATGFDADMTINGEKCTGYQ